MRTITTGMVLAEKGTVKETGMATLKGSIATGYGGAGTVIQGSHPGILVAALRSLILLVAAS